MPNDGLIPQLQDSHVVSLFLLRRRALFITDHDRPSLLRIVGVPEPRAHAPIRKRTDLVLLEKNHGE